jgi:hypothetical protein
VKASPETLAWLGGYYAAMDGGRFDEIASYLAEDCRCAYATGHVATGRERIVRQAEQALGALAGIHHTLRGAWEEDGELIFELDVTYECTDGRTITRPGVGIFVLDADRLIHEQRLFVDVSGVWGP